MRLKSLLTEALIEIDQRDIKMIMKPLKKYVKSIQMHVKNKDREGLINDILLLKKRAKFVKAGPITLWALGGMKSSKLKSLKARQADKLNPIDIFIGFPSTEPFYSPNFGVIVIGPPMENFDLLMTSGAMDELEDEGLYDMFRNFSTEQMVRNLIRHELTHWIDDTLNNYHLKKKSNLQGRTEEVAEYYELQAIIHQVDQLQTDLGQKYLDLTWRQFLDKMPDIEINIENAPGFKEKFLKRMVREKLLTDKMKRTINR